MYVGDFGGVVGGMLRGGAGDEYNAMFKPSKALVPRGVGVGYSMGGLHCLGSS